MAYDYHERQVRHRQALHTLIDGLAAELTRITSQPWTARYIEDHESMGYLDRADGLGIQVSWYEGTGNRPHVSPQVPTLPGRYAQEKVDLSAAFNPDRPIAAVAKDVLRRVVQPWEQELPRLRERHARTLDQRQSTEVRAATIARALGTTLREDAPQLIADGNDLPIGIGDFSTGLDVDVKVSNYKERATFKIEVDGDQEFVLELAALCRKRMLERLERNGQTLCPGCSARPADDRPGLCSGCAYQRRRLRLASQEEG